MKQINVSTAPNIRQVFVFSFEMAIFFFVFFLVFFSGYVFYIFS